MLLFTEGVASRFRVSSGMDSNPATPAGGYDVMHAGFGSQADAMWVNKKRKHARPFVSQSRPKVCKLGRGSHAAFFDLYLETP